MSEVKVSPTSQGKDKHSFIGTFEQMPIGRTLFSLFGVPSSKLQASGVNPSSRDKKKGKKGTQDRDCAASKTKPNDTKRRFELLKIEPWEESVDGVSLLDDLVAVFKRYLALPKGAAEVLALWVLFAHTFDAWQINPRLALTSPTKRCGKTTALSILGCLVPRPMLASNISPAVVFRLIEEELPTVLMDEADTFVEERNEFRGILNSGHNRMTAWVWRCDGDKHEPRGFSTWAPLAVAKIGELYDTLHDRSIVVRMRRRLPDEDVDRFRSDRIDDLECLARKAARWAEDRGVFAVLLDEFVSGAVNVEVGGHLYAAQFHND